MLRLNCNTPYRKSINVYWNGSIKIENSLFWSCLMDKLDKFWLDFKKFLMFSIQKLTTFDRFCVWSLYHSKVEKWTRESTKDLTWRYHETKKGLTPSKDTCQLRVKHTRFTLFLSNQTPNIKHFISSTLKLWHIYEQTLDYPQNVLRKLFTKWNYAKKATKTNF